MFFQNLIIIITAGFSLFLNNDVFSLHLVELECCVGYV
jgi:hypothetical protein